MEVKKQNTIKYQKEYQKEYRKKNADKIKQYRLDNPNYQKEYRIKNAEKILQLIQKNEICECGRIIQQYHKKYHLQTKAHIKAINIKSQINKN